LSIPTKNRVPRHSHSASDIVGTVATSVRRASSNPGYLGGNLHITGMAEIPCDAKSMTRQEILNAIYWNKLQYLTSDAASGQPTIAVADTSEFGEGDEVTLKDQNGSEKVIILSKTATSITMTSNLVNSYSTAANATVTMWAPYGFAAQTNVLRFKDNLTENYADFLLITSSESNDDPLVVFDQGFIVKKDLAVGGFGAFEQGTVYLGHGMLDYWDRPNITLLHDHIADPWGGFFDCLEIRKFHGGYGQLRCHNVYTDHLTPTTAGSIQFHDDLIPSEDAGEGTGFGIGSPTNVLSGVMARTGYFDEIKKVDGSAYPMGSDDELFTASGAVTQYRIVSIVGNETVSTATTANSQASIGVAQANASNGQQVTVKVRGRTYVTAGQTLQAGDHVASDDQGRAVKLSGHRHTAGVLGESLAFASSVSTGNPSDTTTVMTAISIGSTNSAHLHTVVGTTGTPSATNTVVTSVSSLGSTITYVGGSTANANPTTPHAHGFSGGAAVDIAHSHGTGTAAVASSGHSHYYSAYTGNGVAEGGHTHNHTPTTTTVASNIHTHTISGLPTYIRSLTMYAVGGGTFYLGGVLSNTNGAQANVYTAPAAEPFMRAIVVQGATVGNLAQIIIS
jgi:hypothetical protein